MANSSLQRSCFSSVRVLLLRSNVLSRSFSSSDALMEVNPGEIGIVSGIPDEQLKRRVIIYSPARTASQQGSGKVGKWKINLACHSILWSLWEERNARCFRGVLNPPMKVVLAARGLLDYWCEANGDFKDVKQSSFLFLFDRIIRWENPLMGWTSTGDPYANVGEAGLTFDSAEAAKAFAEKHGWEYVIKKRHTPVLKIKAYADNFKWKGPPETKEE